MAEPVFSWAMQARQVAQASDKAPGIMSDALGSDRDREVDGWPGKQPKLNCAPTAPDHSATHGRAKEGHLSSLLGEAGRGRGRLHR